VRGWDSISSSGWGGRVVAMVTLETKYKHKFLEEREGREGKGGKRKGEEKKKKERKKEPFLASPSLLFSLTPCYTYSSSS
jgi:hypothetical protein